MKSIVSYPERGNGGKASYRGNCSPKLIEDLISFYHPHYLLDPMCGSGTSNDVCERMGIKCDALDLNPEWGGWDAMTDEIPGVYDMVFFHPPYANIIQYSGKQWGNLPDMRDLSTIPLSQYDKFLDKLNHVTLRLYQSLRIGGKLAILIGDVKKNGQLYSIQKDMAWIGTPEQMIIKTQHNCWSDKNDYGNAKFIPIVHEYCIVLKKDHAYIVPAIVVSFKKYDWRKSNKLSWRQAVRYALENLGGKASLKDLYNELSQFVKTKNHKTPDAKIRETIQHYPEFKSECRGVWELVPAA